MFCNNCENRLTDGSAFCGECGARAVSSPSVTTTTLSNSSLADISTQSGPELHDTLSEAGRQLKALQDTMDKIKTERISINQEAAGLHGRLVKMAVVAGVLSMIPAAMMASFDENSIGQIVSGGLILVLMIFSIVIILRKKKAAEEGGIARKDELNRQVSHVLAEYTATPANSDKPLALIPPKYRYLLTLLTLSEYIEENRAHTWQECTELLTKSENRHLCESLAGEFDEEMEELKTSARAMAIITGQDDGKS